MIVPGIPRLTWLVLDEVQSHADHTDPSDAFTAEQQKMVRIEEAEAARSRKLASYRQWRDLPRRHRHPPGRAGDIGPSAT